LEAKLQHIKVEGLACKKRRNTGVQLQFNQGLNYKTFKTSRAKIKITIKHKNGAVSRHCSSSSTIQPPTTTITPAINE